MEFLILLVVLVTLLIVTNLVAAYAERKGRSYWGFFILTFLCLPLGVLAAVLAEPNQENIAVSSDLVKCRFCAEYIKQEAVVCKHCGKDLNSSAVKEKTRELEAIKISAEAKKRLTAASCPLCDAPGWLQGYPCNGCGYDD